MPLAQLLEYQRESASQSERASHLEREAALLFAPEAQRVYPEEGWAAWQWRYPQVCAAFGEKIADEKELREVQKTVRRAPRKQATTKLTKDIGVTR